MEKISNELANLSELVALQFALARIPATSEDIQRASTAGIEMREQMEVLYSEPYGRQVDGSCGESAGQQWKFYGL